LDAKSLAPVDRERKRQSASVGVQSGRAGVEKKKRELFAVCF
jgi:hypothetical protein